MTPAVTVLRVPRLAEDTSTLTAALAYAEAGWYVLPVARGSRNPGSILGSGWPDQSSRDPGQIAAWFAGTDHGIALHVGRSGAVALDVDHPDRLTEPLTSAVNDSSVPFQASRRSDPRRGHAVFRVPAGRRVGNGLGRLPRGWGEVRGTNGVIIAAPIVHGDDDGSYRWLRTGPVPALPNAVLELLPDRDAESTVAATRAEVTAFLLGHTAAERPWLLGAVLNGFDAAYQAGQSRHEALVTAACWAAREALAGAYPAWQAYMALRARFVHALANPVVGAARVETEECAAAECNEVWAWAIGQALAEGPEACRARLEPRHPPAGKPPGTPHDTRHGGPPPAVGADPPMAPGGAQPVTNTHHGADIAAEPLGDWPELTPLVPARRPAPFPTP